MPANRQSPNPVNYTEIADRLPKSFFVRRGHIRHAFALSEDEMAALVPDVFKPTYLPPNKRRKLKKSYALFVRTQVLAVARRWEGLQ
jgi:hypothetical protein